MIAQVLFGDPQMEIALVGFVGLLFFSALFSIMGTVVDKKNHPYIENIIYVLLGTGFIWLGLGVLAIPALVLVVAMLRLSN